MKRIYVILVIFLALFMIFSCTGTDTENNTGMNENTNEGTEESLSYPITDFEPTEREATTAENGKEVEINVFSTNDEHGWVFDWDFGQDAPRMSRGEAKPSGLARISTLYKKLSAENPNSMIVSAGDIIQGTILTYYYNFIEVDTVNPMVEAMDYIGYETWTIGNHEVEQGNEVTLKAVNEAIDRGIYALSANAVWEDNKDKPFYLPYHIKEVEGVRIAFLGMTTPGIPLWLSEETHKEHEFMGMVETAKKYVKILRETEKADVIIGVFHAGMNENYDIEQANAEGVPAPNASRLVAKEIGSGPEGLDLIVCAHSHQLIDDSINTEFDDTDSNVINGVKFIQSSKWGEYLGHTKIKVVGENGEWKVKEITAQNHSVEGIEEDPEYLAHMDEYIQGALNYADTPVAEATADLPSQKSYYQETAIVDLIHETQRHFSEAEISIAAAFNPNLTIPKGEITVGNIAGIYIYENFLYAIELTGQQIKDYLEYSSEFFNVITEENVDSTPLVNPDARGYNYDMAQGFQYEIDITKEPGNRIINMKNMDGTPFDFEKTYTVTLNSYRYNGGGGHLAACGAIKDGIVKAKTTYVSSLPMRDLMVEYLREKGTWGPEDIIYNWKLVPEDLAEKAIQNQLGNTIMVLTK